MTFIIALGVIIVLLCTASVFKLMQPRQESADKPKVKASKSKKIDKKKLKKEQNSPHIEPSLHQKHAKQAPIIQKTQPATKPVKPISTTPMPAPQAVVIYLRAPEGRNYCGYELLQALLSAGMRFGKMNIFHRHEQKTGVGPILFSLASAEKPGTFDLAKIGAFYSKALTLFMQPEDVANPVKVYEMMLDTANQLIEDLGGTVLDEKRQLLKKEKVLNTHQLLRNYHESKQSQDILP